MSFFFVTLRTELLCAYEGAHICAKNMTQSSNISSLSESMELTMDKGNLSVLGDLGEVAIDAVMDDGILRDVPILSTVVGLGKCFRNVSDVLFAKKLIVFLYGLKDADVQQREEAISKWESDAKYRIRVGEILLNMINRCDDTQKAQWLSKLFYEMVLKRGWGDMFMRAEKVLSSLSVMDMCAFLAQPKDKYRTLSIDETEWYANSGLYMMIDNGDQVGMEFIKVKAIKMRVTEVGMYIYEILNEE